MQLFCNKTIKISQKNQHNVRGAQFVGPGNNSEPNDIYLR